MNHFSPIYRNMRTSLNHYRLILQPLNFISYIGITINPIEQSQKYPVYCVYVCVYNFKIIGNKCSIIRSSFLQIYQNRRPNHIILEFAKLTKMNCLQVPVETNHKFREPLILHPKPLTNVKLPKQSK